MGSFRKAERKRARAKIAVIGASGSGKTYTSILIAMGLSSDNKRIAMIDTEQGSGELYSHLGDYDVMRINAPYTPDKLKKGIADAVDEGYDVLIIDSLSPFWSGDGGLLEMKTAVEKRGKSSWAAWAEITPLYSSMMEKIITSDIHIIATMRTKTEWVVEPGSGKDSGLKVTKVGTAPVQRDGAEYEFTIVFMLDQSHVAMATKDRTGLFDNVVFTPNVKTGTTIRAWLDSGAEAPEVESIPTNISHDEIVREEIKNIPSESKSRIHEDLKNGNDGSTVW